jgi:hypothetical protein
LANVRAMISLRSAAALLSVSLIACGGGDDGNHPIDGHMGGDTGGAVCTTALSFGEFDIGNDDFATENGGIGWYTILNGTLADQNEIELDVIFQGGAAIPAGDYDLSEGDNANFATCQICVVAFGGTSDNPRYFFQKSGTLTLNADPITGRTLDASFSNLTLQEVTIDADTLESTAIPTGECATFASASGTADRVPAAYQCDASTWLDGTTCNCLCDVLDPDCYTAGLTTDGCTDTTQACIYDFSVDPIVPACVDRPANDTCADVTTALTVGAAGVDGTTIGAENNYDAGLDADDCTGYFEHPGPDTAYKVSLTADTAYNISLTIGDENTDLAVAVLGPSDTDSVCTADPITTCVSGADAGFNGDPEMFTFTPTTTGTYWILVDSWDKDVKSAYHLTVDVAP